MYIFVNTRLYIHIYTREYICIYIQGSSGGVGAPTESVYALASGVRGPKHTVYALAEMAEYKKGRGEGEGAPCMGPVYIQPIYTLAKMEERKKGGKGEGPH